MTLLQPSSSLQSVHTRSMRAPAKLSVNETSTKILLQELVRRQARITHTKESAVRISFTLLL